MIARRRGEHDSTSRWRPITGRQLANAVPKHSSPDGATLAPQGLGPLRGSARRANRWLLALCAAAGAYAAATWGLARLTDTPAHPRLPPTPRAWLDAYEAAAIDNPDRVCTDLFAPQLARAYGKAIHGTCRTYFRRITSFSVVVRRVFRDGSTALLELHQTVHPANWAVVLSRGPDGWQAVDLVPGAPLR
jgi:hypothetical protein